MKPYTPPSDSLPILVEIDAAGENAPTPAVPRLGLAISVLPDAHPSALLCKKKKKFSLGNTLLQVGKLFILLK